MSDFSKKLKVAGFRAGLARIFDGRTRTSSARGRHHAVPCFLVCCAIVSVSAAQESPFRFEGKVPGKNNEQVVTDVRINDHLITVSVDTGASADIILYPAAAEKIGLKIAEKPKYGAAPGQGYFGKTEPATFQIGALTIQNFEVPVFQAAPNGHEGILGWAGIANNIWAFLFADQQFLALEEVPEAALTWTKFAVVPQTPEVLCITPAKKTNPAFLIRVDTGNSGGVMLPKDEWTRWKAQNQNQRLYTTYMYLTGLDKPVRLEVGWAGEFRLGDVTLSGVPVQEAPPGYYEGNPGERVIALGMGALKRMELVVDSSNRMAYAKAVETAPEPIKHGTIGLFELADDVVAQIEPDGPAARAGIRKGDKILSINGQSLKDFGEHADRVDHSKWEATVETMLQVALMRNGESMKVEIKVTAEDLLGPKTTTPPRAEQKDPTKK